MTFGFRAAPQFGLPVGPTIWFQAPWVCAPIGVRTFRLVSLGRQAGVLVGSPLPVASTGTPAQLATSMRTETLPFSASTRSGAGLPAALAWAHVGRPVVPPRYGSQHASVVARMRVALFELPTTVTVWVPTSGALGVLMRYTHGVRSEVTYRLPSVATAVVNGLTPRPPLVGKRPGVSRSEAIIVCEPGS